MDEWGLRVFELCVIFCSVLLYGFCPSCSENGWISRFRAQTLQSACGVLASFGLFCVCIYIYIHIISFLPLFGVQSCFLEALLLVPLSVRFAWKIHRHISTLPHFDNMLSLSLSISISLKKVVMHTCMHIKITLSTCHRSFQKNS